jgi:hypothetical protein
VVPALAAPAPGDDEAGSFEDAEVLHGRAPIKVGEVGAQLVGGPGMVPEQSALARHVISL